MTNPTDKDYSYSWINCDNEASSALNMFKFQSHRGILKSQNKVDVTFDFNVNSSGSFESFWIFKIEKYNVEMLFLLVAFVRDPLVFFIKSPTILHPYNSGFFNFY